MAFWWRNSNPWKRWLAVIAGVVLLTAGVLFRLFQRAATPVSVPAF